VGAFEVVMARTAFLITVLAWFGPALLGAQPAPASPNQKPADRSPHTVQFVEVEPGVKLEVLDWGGTGRPLILLAGLGFDAHNFDEFAQKLTARSHVYGITRRGYGASSTPEPTPENYSAHRLGDDVLAVMTSLHIERPVLVGHSIAGEELSSIGTRFPEKVAGLVYLDAGYPYAYYDPDATKGSPQMDWSLVRHEMDTLFTPTVSVPERKAAMKQLVESDLPRLEKDMQDVEKQMAGEPDTAPPPPDKRLWESGSSVMRGVEVHKGVKCPVLAIYAVPHDFSKMPGLDEKKRAEMIERDKIDTGAQADAFAKGNPQARVVRIANAEHFVFKSNEADVLREMDAFMATLP
jgi:non-heme chloroperoxidase